MEKIYISNKSLFEQIFNNKIDSIAISSVQATDYPVGAKIYLLENTVFDKRYAKVFITDSHKVNTITGMYTYYEFQLLDTGIMSEISRKKILFYVLFILVLSLFVYINNDWAIKIINYFF